METTCQRCHETLRDADRYCPACGLPQLTYATAEPSTALEIGEEGVVPLRGAGKGLDDPGGIAWRQALRAALILAVPVAVLSYRIMPVGLMWMVGAAAWAVALYARRAGRGGPTMGAGAQIGLITGLFAAWLTVCFEAVDLWVSRFLLHEGNQFDAMWLDEVQKSFEHNQQVVSQMGVSGDELAQVGQISLYFRDTMLSVEGRAGWALCGLLIFAALLVFFATVGGAVGARLLVRRPRPSA